MRRTTLILVIILIFVVLGGGGYLWVTHPAIVLPWASNTNSITNTATTNTTTNTAPKTITLPTEVKGDTAVTGTFKLGQVTVTFNSQQKQATLDGVTADSGQTFLLVYFDGLSPADVVTVDQGLRGAKLSDGHNTYSLLALKVASTYVTGDRGFLKFSMPDQATNLQLQLGSGATLQSVKLP